MSDNGSGFDWISILVIVVAGGISIIKGFFKKTTREEPPVWREPEYTYEEEEEESEEYEIVDRYNNTEKENISSPKVTPTFLGDYYKESETQKEDRFSMHEDILQEEEEEESVYDFDIRQAIVASEILRRPQY